MTHPVRIYLDHNATAPLRPEARAAMLACFDAPGNPSSAHREGALARRRLEDARAEVAALIGAAPAEIIFTSGATEANNLALRGLGTGDGPVLTTAIEHASVLDTARTIGPVRIVGVDGVGRLDVDSVAAAAAGSRLVSIGLANGEIGVVAPLGSVAARLAGTGVILHSDAAQAAGRIAVDVRTLGLDALSLSSHKLGGPLGVGALWLRSGCALRPQLTGGPQERDRRAGTENVPALVGFAAAARAARLGHEHETSDLARRRDRLWQRVSASIAGLTLNGPSHGPRLPNTLNVMFDGCAGESLLVLLDLAGLAVSLGSACAAGAAAPSHVLQALGHDADTARNGIRFSLGPDTTDEEIDRAALLVVESVAAVRRRAAA